MHKLPMLQSGDTVEIIAPASRCTDKDLTDLQTLLTSWGLKCKTDDGIFGDDLLCANTDETRFSLLKKALENKNSKAIICARGGYGSMRLLPALEKISALSPKLFVGMSDITALNLFLQQKWQWPVIHGAMAPDRFSAESIAALKAILFREVQQVEFIGHPLNSAAKNISTIESTIIGGNLCLLQTSIGTSWQVDGRNKIIFLEEVSERGYRIDRMLEHLHQAKIFDGVSAILLGDFIGGAEANGTSLVKPVLERFAQTCKIPVIKIDGVGHDKINFPLPLGTKATITLGEKIKLACEI